MQPFTAEGIKFDYGTILVPVQNQSKSPQEIAAILEEISNSCFVTFKGVQSGLTQGVDLGSDQFKTIKPQKIGLLVGEGINSYDAGEIWHLLDTRYNIRITKLDVANLGKTDLFFLYRPHYTCYSWKKF